MSRTATIWNNENEQFLIENFAFITNRRLSEQLDISISSIKKKAHELRLNKGCVKRKIIPSLEKDVLKMSKTNSYRFVAEMLSISLSSVSNIINNAASKGYKKRSKQDTGKIMSETRKRIIKKERARAVFGLDPRTKIKVYPNKQKYHMRDRLKRCRYIVERNGIDVFIDEETRRHNTIEDDARRLGFNIQKTVIAFYPIDFVFENGSAEEQIAEELLHNKYK